MPSHAETYPCDRINAFRALADAIQRDLAAGRITPMQYRDRLTAARNTTGVSQLGHGREYVPPKAAEMTDVEFRTRKSEISKRSRARKAATSPTP